MPVNSDPQLASLRASTTDHWSSEANRRFVQRADAATPVIARNRDRWRLATGAALLLAVVVGARSLLSILTSPLPASSVGSAAAWSIEITAAGSKPVTALIYGEEAGFHLVRVPAAAATRDEARVIAARLGKGEVHMLSLGFSGLRAHAVAPAGAPKVSWHAEGHVITAYQRASGTGVRTSW